MSSGPTAAIDRAKTLITTIELGGAGLDRFQTFSKIRNSEQTLFRLLNRPRLASEHRELILPLWKQLNLFLKDRNQNTHRSLSDAGFSQRRLEGRYVILSRVKQQLIEKLAQMDGDDVIAKKGQLTYDEMAAQCFSPNPRRK